MPKLIPRTHNDYVYNSKMAGSVTGVGGRGAARACSPSRTICRSPVPGFRASSSRARRLCSPLDPPEPIFRLVEKHSVTHIHVVPALLIRWLADPAIARYDLSSLRVIQSGGQRLQPETRRRKS